MNKSKKRTSDIPNYDTLPSALQDYIKYKLVIENRTFKTVRGYTYDLAYFLRYIFCLKTERDTDSISLINIEFFEDDFFRSITRSEVLEYLYYLKTSRHNETNSRYRKLEAIKSFFKYLLSESIIEEDITASIDLPNLDSTLPKYLTKEESFTLLDNISGRDYERDFCMIVIFLNCGLRLSELVNIDITDIHGNTLRVNGKGNVERDIELSPLCISAIRQYLLVRGNCEKAIVHKNALFISRKTGRRIGERRVQQIVSDSLKAAGLEGYSTHKLRHTAATLAFQNGVEINVIQAFLGHKNLSTTQIYTHISNKQLKEVVYKNPISDYQPPEKH